MSTERSEVVMGREAEPSINLSCCAQPKRFTIGVLRAPFMISYERMERSGTREKGSRCQQATTTINHKHTSLNNQHSLLFFLLSSVSIARIYANTSI